MPRPSVGHRPGPRLRPEVRRHTWQLLTITLSVWTVQQVIQGGVPSRMVNQMYTAQLIAAVWPQGPTHRLRRRARAMLKRIRRCSTGIPIPNSSALIRLRSISTHPARSSQLFSRRCERHDQWFGGVSDTVSSVPCSPFPSGRSITGPAIP